MYIENIKNTPQVDLKISNYNLQDKPLANLLSNFDTTIKNAINPEDLALYYRNISDLKIKVLKDEDNFKTTKILGAYYNEENQITIYEKLPKIIYHELFHMASSYTQEKMFYLGFAQAYEQNKKIVYIGNGINEGYTELLTERYFGNVATDGNNNYGKGYQVPMYFVHKLEQIIGQESMEKLYLIADLKGLIENLKKFTYDWKIDNFLYYTDFLWQADLSANKMGLFEYFINYVNHFLLETYLKKLMQENLNQMAMISKILSYISDLMVDISIQGTTFHTFTDEDVEKTIELTLKNYKFQNSRGILIKKR